MSHLLKAILAKDKACTAVYYAQRTYDSAHDANEKAQKQLTRHQDSADRRVRIKYAQRATGLLDALDEAREALEAAIQAAELAKQKEAYFGQRVKQTDVVAGVVEGRNMGPVIEAEWEEKMALVSA